jgi:integrase
MGKLTARQIENAKGPKRLIDGDGLTLAISPTGKKRFLIRFSRQGKVNEKALGLYPYMSLAEARTAAFDFKRNLKTGIATPRRVTFEALARETVLNRLESYKHPQVAADTNERHLRYAKPLCDLDVASISIDQVSALLRPLWIEKSQTADRIRSLIEQVLDVAIVKGLRVTPNSAKYKGTLSHVLGRKVTLPRGHHKALAYSDVPDLMRRLEDEGGVVARALRLTILCALRKSETYNLRWEHVGNDMLVIPSDLMKMRQEFRAPLSSGALAVLDEQRSFGRATGFVFPSPLRAGQPLSANAINDLLGRLKVDATVHGFRSSARDFAAEMTDAPREVAEAMLAHTVGGVEGAYKRTDFFAKRAVLAQAWSDFLVRSP